MRFEEWMQSRMEGEAARSLDPASSPSMRLVDAPMSRAGFTGSKIPHGEYRPRNFDRYAFKVDEEGAAKYLDRLRKAIRNDVQTSAEALAGYYGNDGVVKALDDFLTDLSRSNVVL
jgi:hypothetical protein